MNEPHHPHTLASLEPPGWVRNRPLLDWVAEAVKLVKPDRVVWCDGSQAEYDRLCDELVEIGRAHV